MAKPSLSYLYRETRLNLDPTSPSSTIHFTLPSTSSIPLLRSRTSQKQIVDTADEDIDQDEEGFTGKHLATEASIFFRREASSPRCFSWRLLADRRVLELQVVDLTQRQGAEQDVKFTLIFRFPTAIRPFGLAFAELNEQDAFNVFALTTDKELYTLTIHKSFFISPSVTDGNVGGWCNIYTHPALGYRLPYRIFSIDHREVLISLHDGGILRLEQVAKDGSWTWKDFIYAPGEGGWGASIRGLIPWSDHHTAQFDDISLQPTASAALAASPEGNHLFTVGLNYMLRIRDHRTGAVCAEVDLLAQEDAETRSKTRNLMGPRQRSLLQVVKPEALRDGDLYYVTTYSPKDHQFKFWGIRDADADAAANGIYDIHPELKLIPPVDKLLSTSVWSVEEFYLRPTRFLRSTELWIRARVGAISQVFSLKFSLFDDPDFLQTIWTDNWVAVDTGTMDANILKSHARYPTLRAVDNLATNGDDVTEKALEFIFFPDRFTSATLESALCRYRTGLDLPSSRAQHPRETSKIPLRQRICEAVAANASLQPKAGVQEVIIDYGAYQAKTAEQWNIFAELVIELHRRRTEALSLAFDEKSGLPWVLSADYIAPIRKCSEIELLQLNKGILSIGDETLEVSPIVRSLKDRESLSVGCLLSIASSFRQHLPRSVRDTISVLATAEAFQQTFISMDERIQFFYDQCDFAEHITDEDLSLLSGAFDPIGGFTEVNNDLFRRALHRLDSDTEGHEQSLSLMTYGERALVRGAQEILENGLNVLLDLLVLAVVMTIDFEDSVLLPNNFVPSAICAEIMNRLGEHELLRFLASTKRIEPPSLQQTSREKSKPVASPDVGQKKGQDVLPTVTLLWSFFIGDWKSIPCPEIPELSMTSLLTYWIHNWTHGADLHGSYDEITADIMSNLLIHKDFDLATDFVPFLTGSPWPTYLKARLLLERDELVEAARVFKKAGYGLSRISKNKTLPGAEQVKDVQQMDGHGLLALHEVRYFNEGNVGPYYQHVAELFERARPQAWTYVAEFSRMAIWHFDQKRFMRKEAGIDDFDVIDRKKIEASQPRESQSSRRSVGGDKYTQRSPLGLRNSSLGSIEAGSDSEVKHEGDDSLENSMALIDYSIAELGAIKDYEAKQESLGRLFTALVKTGRWEEAYATLVRYEKPDV